MVTSNCAATPIQPLAVLSVDQDVWVGVVNANTIAVRNETGVTISGTVTLMW